MREPITLRWIVLHRANKHAILPQQYRHGITSHLAAGDIGGLLSVRCNKLLIRTNRSNAREDQQSRNQTLLKPKSCWCVCLAKPQFPWLSCNVMSNSSIVFRYRLIQSAAERSPLFGKLINSKPKKIRQMLFFISGKYTECRFTSTCFEQNVTQEAALNIDTLM